MFKQRKIRRLKTELAYHVGKAEALEALVTRATRCDGNMVYDLVEAKACAAKIRAQLEMLQ